MLEGLKIYKNKVAKLINKHYALVEREKKVKEDRIALDKEELDLIRELEDIGMTLCGLDDGTTLSIVETYHCNINKNYEDQYNVADWLKEQGAESLVKETYTCYEKPKDVVSITCVEINTTKVKSWVTSALGLKEGSIATLEMKDLPKGLHFFIDKRIKIS